MRSASPTLARSALDAAPDAMIIIDRSGLIRFANRQASALFGYPHDELIGKPVEHLMPERFREQHPALRESYTRDVRFRAMGTGLELFGQRQDGSEFPVEISLSPVEDEHERRALVAAAIRDVSDRKRIAAELVLARQSADRANQSKSRFLATASHDLRQPLQTVALLNGALRRMLENSAATEALTQQEQAIRAMARLLNALLDISKLESGAVKPDPTDFTVAALFEELRTEFAGLAADKGLSFRVESCEDGVHSDPMLVGQILRNLISNAIRYTRAGWVALRCLHESSSLVRIEVLDSGIGIPTEQLRYIYDEFYQVGVPANRTREGYGLGLSIVQRLVSLLDARLDVHSEVGKGSQFALSLPACERVASPTHQIKPERPEHVAHSEARILLVEDDAAVRNATRMLLKSDGYQVIAVSSAADALEHVAHDPRVDLLVTDYHLADGETGTEAIAALRRALDRPLKAVLITGDTSSAIAALPPDPLMQVASKPVDADQLLSLLRTLLATR
jgi:PAS domain S-box-containing protein